MLSFSSIYNELQTDLMQQEAKLEIFSSNNFAWLKRIKNEFNIEDEKKDSSEKNGIITITNNNEERKDILQNTKETQQNISDDVQKVKPILDTNSHYLQRVSSLKSCLRVSISNQDNINSNFMSESSPGKDDKQRHVSFGIRNSLQDSEHAMESISDPLISDSSELSGRGDYLACMRAQENAASNVTPQRSSVARQALHSSFDRISLQSKAKENLNKDVTSPYGYESIVIESSASYFPSDSEQSSSPGTSPQKDSSIGQSDKTDVHDEDNKGKSTPTFHRKFADINDIRLSLDPTAILLTPEELITPSQGRYSVASHSNELSEQAKSNRERWAKMIAEKKQTEQKGEIQDESSEDETDSAPYIMSDHESDADDDDDKELEIFEAQAEEIHGQKIPEWARGETLLKHLEKQSKVDPDTIFPDFSNTCTLNEVFGKNNPRWQVRTDSAKWDLDGLTPEEINSFKQTLGLV